jgi:hypothetical protein
MPDHLRFSAAATADPAALFATPGTMLKLSFYGPNRVSHGRRQPADVS